MGNPSYSLEMEFRGTENRREEPHPSSPGFDFHLITYSLGATELDMALADR
jgi:hypothetical protein